MKTKNRHRRTETPRNGWLENAWKLHTGWDPSFAFLALFYLWRNAILSCFWMWHGRTPQCCHRRVYNGASGGRSLSLVTSQAQIVATVRRRRQCLPKKDDVEPFHTDLNSINPHIQLIFILEMQTACIAQPSIAFLDTNFTVLHDDRREVTVYRKATHTNKYLSFDS